MRNWQKALLGQALIDALRGGAKPPQAKLFSRHGLSAPLEAS